MKLIGWVSHIPDSINVNLHQTVDSFIKIETTEESYKFNDVKPQKTQWDADLERDHIIPLVLVGTLKSGVAILNSINNIQYLHTECHKTKTKEDLNIITKYRAEKKLLIKSMFNIKSYKHLTDEQRFKLDIILLDNMLNSEEFNIYRCMVPSSVIESLKKLAKNT